MAFSDPLNVRMDEDDSTDYPFGVVEWSGPKASIRKNQSSGLTAGTPKILRISHTRVGKGQAARDRHLVRIEANAVVDGVETNTVVAGYAVFDVPVLGFNQGQVNEICSLLCGTIRGNNASTGDFSPDLTLFFEKFVGGSF